MESSDEEGEILPGCINNYEFQQFMNNRKEAISFSFLPLQLGMNEPEHADGLKLQVFLHGTCDSGLQVIYKQVLAWRYELSYVQPEIYVLCKDNHWIKLQRPKKSFEPIIRSILITIQALHYAKRFPEAPEGSVWSHLSRYFSSYDVGPSVTDILWHIGLVRDAAYIDKDLAKSEFLVSLLSEEPRKEKDGPVKKVNIYVDDDTDDDLDELDDQADELFDTCCAICDNGGDILCCQGRCMRSFHATIDSGEGLCTSLGLSKAEVEAMPIFLCKNCQHQRHQCFLCGKLGSSNKSCAPEVFPCVAATCGRFYHPKCVAKALHQANDIQAGELEEKIAAGESFACPAHKCLVCKGGENRKISDLQFAVCRRCPKAYHRKCLPSDICFENYPERQIMQRAWDDLLPGRILIYCLDHEIVPELGTPMRNHLRFSGVSVKIKRRTPEQVSTTASTLEKKRKIIFGTRNMEGSRPKIPKLIEKADMGGSEPVLQSRVNDLMVKIQKPNVETQPLDARNSSAMSGSKIVVGGSQPRIPKPIENANREGLDPVPKFRVNNLMSKTQKYNVKTQLMKAHNSKAMSGKQIILGLRSEKLGYGKTKPWSMPCKVPQPKFTMKPKPQGMTCKNVIHTITTKSPIGKPSSSRAIEESEIQTRISALIEKVNSSFDTDGFLEKQTNPSAVLFSRSTTNKSIASITKGKVEVAVKAVQTALQKLDAGCSTEDAMAVCGPDMLQQILRWKRKLNIHLAPFLHGPRYSSHGRHFTKIEKLQEVVERLHWYVQDGDMIVDFCCGANEFSCLMKEKLDSLGKNCLFKNYDIFQPQNDFNFEKRDWFTVGLEELPDGSQLIMGLNPPFGVNASRANQFINRALRFKPKLIILIVPEQTERLDAKRNPYDLLWEDRYLLAGKSFYLPGSVDVHDKQLEQWNLETPPLYLWSRPDWTCKHKAIARKCGHLPDESHGTDPVAVEASIKEVSNYLMEEENDCYRDFSGIIDDCDLDSLLADIPDESELNHIM